MSINKSISKFYKPVGYKVTPEMALRDCDNPSSSNNQVLSSDSGLSFNRLGATGRLNNTDTFWTKNHTTANEVQFGLSDESSSTSLSSSSSDLMSSSVIEGKCCEEHLSLTREMAIRLLKEYVKNLKDFSSMMREKQSTTLRDTSTSPIHSPVIDSNDKHKCAIKRDTQNSDNTVSRQRPSSMLGVSHMHQTSYDLAQSDRTKTSTSFFSSLDHVIDIPVAFMKKQNFTARSVCKVIKQPDNPGNSLEESYSTKTDKCNWFNKNNLDSDDSGQQTPVNFESGLQTAVLKSEKHYQLEKDPGKSVPILSSTSTLDNNQSSKDCKKDTQKHLGRIVMMPPQPDILKFERPHKPNVIIADERLNGEGIVTEKQSEAALSSPNQLFHTQISSDFSRTERLRIKSPSPSYSSSVGSPANSFHSTPSRPELHSSPTPQAKTYHSGAPRSSSVQRVIPHSSKETLWIRNSYNTPSQNPYRSLVKSSSSIPLSGTPSYSDSVLPKITSPFSQPIFTPNCNDYMEYDVNQLPKHVLSKTDFSNTKFNNNPIRTIGEIPILGRGTRTQIVTEDLSLSPNKPPKKYGVWPNSTQIPPAVSQQMNPSTKQQDNISQYKNDLFYRRKSDKIIQTDDFDDDDSWITGSLDSPNNQDLEISCEPENPSPVNEPNLQTWTLSLQSIVRPTESESILPKANEISCTEHINIHIEKKPSESKIQPNLECDRKLWRRHSLRINPSESDNYQTTQRNLNQFNDRPNQRLSLPRKPKNTSRFSIGSSSELDTPKCRSVHFSNDVLVAHTGSGPEPLLLSSAPLKEPASDDEQEQNGKPSYFTKLSVDCGHNMSNFLKPKSRTNINRPSAPLPFRRQFVLNTSNNVNS
ncbi:hypothetical protein MS3_00001989 [Schistosoma haematobium]|uniref:Uncharacterized protein n=1 Tax=Schistosoma haematobium TaxID=6185 RepID=A0A922LYV8_SCHHA|nr:hypothetical protein MS3_00001989 [Schistosoma haematobium]KAH9596248.1 hypothetical protein MS3_00001989 [Schistosoma haematobium]